jgi:hypothetical protein
LWLGEHDRGQALPKPLRRLQRQGLEIRYCADVGPHTKYFPYVRDFADEGLPLVTADDDGIYGRRWLSDLLAAHQAQPDVIHGHWVRQMEMSGGHLEPYQHWKNAESPQASSRHFALGVAGVIYPPAFVKALRRAGDAFLETCPKADDIWLHAVALRNGFRVRQVHKKKSYPRTIPFTQDSALFHANFLPTGNDAQIQRTYDVSDLSLLEHQR